MSAITKLLRAIENDNLDGYVSVGRESEDGPDMVVCELGYHFVSDITPNLLSRVVRFNEEEAERVRELILSGGLPEIKCARLVPWSHFVGWIARELREERVAA